MKNIDILADATNELVTAGMIPAGSVIDTYDGWTRRGFYVKKGMKSVSRVKLWTNFQGRCLLVNTAVFSSSQVEKKGAGRSSTPAADMPESESFQAPAAVVPVPVLEKAVKNACVKVELVKNQAYKKESGFTGYDLFIECNGAFYAFPVRLVYSKPSRTYYVCDEDFDHEYTTGKNKEIIKYFADTFKTMNEDKFMKFWNDRCDMMKKAA